MTSMQSRTIHPSDVLRVADLSHDELVHLLDLAAHMKRHPQQYLDSHRGEALACYFAHPSARTCVSFQSAAARLGMTPVLVRPDDLRLAGGEPISDTAKVLSGYVSAIAIRTFDHSELEEVAWHAEVPVINAMTDHHHPCQALADLLTLREHFGGLAGLTVAYVGDGNNVAQSLIEAGALTGIDVRVACPPGYEPHEDIIESAVDAAGVHGGSVQVMADLADAVEGADAVYTGVWLAAGDDGDRSRRLRDLGPFTVSEKLMSLTADHAVFMHCLPAHRGEEVAAAVIDGPRSIVFPQAHNRLPTEQALIHALVTADWSRYR